MNFLENLKQERSIAGKKALLKELSELELKCFILAYDPYIRYGIKPLLNSSFIGIPTEEMFFILEKIRKGVFSRTVAKQKLKEFSAVYGDLINLICNKDLDCGVSAKIFNSVYPNAIKTFNVQLAHKLHPYKLEFPCYAEIKYDGVRVIAVNYNNHCSFFTRTGREINCPELSEIISKNFNSNFVLDGEFVLGSGEVSNRTKISGRVNSALKGGKLLLDNLLFVCFDAMYYSEFTEVCRNDYENRRKLLTHLVADIDNPHVQASKSYFIDCDKQLNNFYCDVVSAGYEGLIVKKPKHLYTFKRSYDWMKIKEKKIAVLDCVKQHLGAAGTKYEDVIGSLECTGYVDGLPIKVFVGSGLSEKERISFKFLWRKVKVEYNQVIPNKNKTGYTLFLPVFREIAS